MFALIVNNQITNIGELKALFPNEPVPTPEFAKLNGALPIVDGIREDENFYWVTFDKYVIEADSVKRTYVSTPKSLDDTETVLEGTTDVVTTPGLKKRYIADFKTTANTLLAKTDWMVIRKMERNVDIPADVAARRAAIVAECDRLINAATQAQDMPAFIAAVKSANWGTDE